VIDEKSQTRGLVAMTRTISIRKVVAVAGMVLARGLAEMAGA
jgi:hypothetical protein